MVGKQHTLFSHSATRAAWTSLKSGNLQIRPAISSAKTGTLRPTTSGQEPREKQVLVGEGSGPVKNPRLGLTKRADPSALPRFRLTDRDREIVQAVYSFRALSAAQVEALLFQPEKGQDHPTKTTRCQLRLKLLYHTGYLFRDEQPQKLSEGRKPLVYFLDRKGAELIPEIAGNPSEVTNTRRQDRNLSQLFLDHLLSTNDVRVAITVAAKHQAWDIETWLDDTTLKKAHMGEYVMLKSEQGKLQQATVVPDGYFILNTGEYVYHHFLEIDRRTVTGEASNSGKRDWARKVRAYLEYYRSGQYEKRYHTQGLRILTVTTGERRLANLREITERAGGKARFWFTTFDKVTAVTVLTASIWQVAGKEGLHSLTW